MKIVGDVTAERPGFIAHIVATPAWGEPARAVETPQPVKVPNSRDGRVPGLETRFTRQWVWATGTGTYGVMIWDLGHRVRPRRYVIEATGPAGRAVFDRPEPLTTAGIEACLHFAGFPVEAPYRFA